MLDQNDLYTNELLEDFDKPLLKFIFLQNKWEHYNNSMTINKSMKYYFTIENLTGYYLAYKNSNSINSQVSDNNLYLLKDKTDQSMKG